VFQGWYSSMHIADTSIPRLLDLRWGHTKTRLPRFKCKGLRPIPILQRDGINQCRQSILAAQKASWIFFDEAGMDRCALHKENYCVYMFHSWWINKVQEKIIEIIPEYNWKCARICYAEKEGSFEALKQLCVLRLERPNVIRMALFLCTIHSQMVYLRKIGKSALKQETMQKKYGNNCAVLVGSLLFYLFKQERIQIKMCERRADMRKEKIVASVSYQFGLKRQRIKSLGRKWGIMDDIKKIGYSSTKIYSTAYGSTAYSGLMDMKDSSSSVSHGECNKSLWIWQCKTAWNLFHDNANPSIGQKIKVHFSILPLSTIILSTFQLAFGGGGAGWCLSATSLHTSYNTSVVIPAY